MLIEFSVTNFRSFQETQTLSLVASATGFQTENTFNSGIAGLPCLLHSAVIYGPNAAGKSNLLLALRFMTDLVLSSAKKGQLGEKIKITPFLFHQQTKTQASEFEVLFIQEGVRYQYGFAVTQERVTHEWLLAYPEKRAQRWFEREYDFSSQQENWYFGNKFKGRRQVWKEATRSNALFLSTAIQLNSTQLKPVFDWFQEQLYIDKNFDPSTTIRQCKTDSSKQKILAFMKAADLSIEDFHLKTKKLSLEHFFGEMPQGENFEKELESHEAVKMLHNVIGDNQEKVALNLEDESDGTQRLFEFAGLWLETLNAGAILVVDELDSSLHPLIMRFLIGLFHKPEFNKHHAQLIMTTHDTTVLDKEIFRRDQIWFVEKNEENATQLYPLSDFSHRKEEAWQKGYLRGRYGALPYVKLSAFDGN